MSAAQIAIVEDEADIAQNYQVALQRQGYQVDWYATREAAWQAFQQRLPDLAILDIGLGVEVEGGFDLCRDLRSLAPALPIMFLTARDSEIDVISGLRLGADDYLSKDISQVHMLARVVALLRRVQSLSQQNKTPEAEVERGDLRLNLERMTCYWQEQLVDLTVTELWIVHALALHPGHVKNRQQLMDAANVVLDDNTITSHIKRIRKKFNALDADFNWIQTAYGMGYRWQAK